MNNKFNISQDQLNDALNRAFVTLTQTDKFSSANGWVDYPAKCSDELKHIKELAEITRDTSDVLVVVGTGGSYLGAEACIQALEHLEDTEVIFVGYTLGSSRINKILDYISNKRFSVNIISRSGSTLETNVVGEIFLQKLKAEYPEDYKSRTIITTTAGSKLAKIANENGYSLLEIPENIGGRYSVMTSVGLFPAAFAGIDIYQIIEGANSIRKDLFQENSRAYDTIYQYISYKLVSYGVGRNIELIVADDERLTKLVEWLRQLIAESLGKSHLGSYPSGALFSRDLHSIGQYIEDGTPNISETLIRILDRGEDIELNYQNSIIFNGMQGCNSLNSINQGISESALEAHYRAGVPIYAITLQSLLPHELGVFFYLFEMAIALLGIIMNINPFDQPAVENYKQIMRSRYPER